MVLAIPSLIIQVSLAWPRLSSLSPILIFQLKNMIRWPCSYKYWIQPTVRFFLILLKNILHLDTWNACRQRSLNTYIDQKRSSCWALLDVTNSSHFRTVHQVFIKSPGLYWHSHKLWGSLKCFSSPINTDLHAINKNVKNSHYRLYTKHFLSIVLCVPEHQAPVHHNK